MRHPVATTTLSATRYDALLAQARQRDYPRRLQRIDESAYAKLGLRNRLVQSVAAGAWYDTRTHRLVLRRAPKPAHRVVLHELVRALVDQNYGLGRLTGLRARDRDAALAAYAVVDGVAALASGRRAALVRGTSLDRFLQLETRSGLEAGRALARELRYLGGDAALATAMRTFPRTTEQLLHIDKFLERERAVAVTLPARIGSAALASVQTFGELDVRNLLQAFSLPAAATIAAGWGGGKLAVYVSGGDAVAALVLRWDSPADAVEWRDGVARYVAAAFPGAKARDCPPLDRCWTGTDEVAAGVFGRTSVLASGPGSATVAAALLGAS